MHIGSQRMSKRNEYWVLKKYEIPAKSMKVESSEVRHENSVKFDMKDSDRLHGRQ